MMAQKIALYVLGLGIISIHYSAIDVRAMLSSQAASAPESNEASDKTAFASALAHQIPREVIYGLLFREVAKFCAQADVLASQSTPNTFLLNHHRNYLELSEPLDSRLKEVAQKCAQQLDDLDRRAFEIIQTTKRRYGGESSGVGTAVPPPPKELLDLQEERKRTVLDAAERLACNFGPAQFAFFESLVRRYIILRYQPSP